MIIIWSLVWYHHRRVWVGETKLEHEQLTLQYFSFNEKKYAPFYLSPFLSSIKSDLILLIANVTVMRWFCWICSKLRFWRTHPVAKMITKKKKKRFWTSSQNIKLIWLPQKNIWGQQYYQVVRVFFFHLYVYTVVPLSGACEMGLCFLMRGITSLPERGDLDVRD